jgi:hypothetical protein
MVHSFPAPVGRFCGRGARLLLLLLYSVPPTRFSVSSLLNVCAASVVDARAAPLLGDASSLGAVLRIISALRLGLEAQIPYK